jgi:uncharacterized protein YaaQ
MRGIAATRVQTMGGFLRQPNHLLLVGIPQGKLEIAVEALRRACRARVEYLAAPPDHSVGPLGAPIPVEVLGATVFTFEVDRYEEI